MSNKVSFRPEPIVNPVPAIMVSCGASPEEHNIITIAWTGIINSEPPMTYISVRKSRHSHGILMKNKEFVINLCHEALLYETDFCGIRSGKNVDKFKEMNLTKEKAEFVSCPMIAEAPVNGECKVVDILHYPSHDVFVAEILRIHAQKELLGGTGRIDLGKAQLICYNNGEYFGLSKQRIGTFGHSAQKSKKE